MRVILTLALALGSATAFTTPRSHLPLTRSTVVGSPFVKTFPSPAVARVRPSRAPTTTMAAPVAAPAVCWAATTAGPAVISALWVLMAYSFLPLGPTATFNGMSPGQCKWGDRSFMNMLEQGPLFLASLWCHALFVSPLTATQLGGVYLALRSLYPGIWLTKGGEAGPPFPFMFNFTFKQYGIAVWFALTTIAKVVFKVSLPSFFGLPSFVGNLIGALVTGELYKIYAVKFVFGLQKPVFGPYFKAEPALE